MGSEIPNKAILAKAGAGNPEVRLHTHSKALRMKMWKAVKKVFNMSTNRCRFMFLC